MAYVTPSKRARGYEATEWVTPTGVVLSAAGDLDERACQALDRQVRRLLARWPGLLLTLDLNQVGHIDPAALEALVLDIVALRAGEARLAFAVKGGDCHALLTRLGLAVEAAATSQTRWPSDLWASGLLLPGGTA